MKNSVGLVILICPILGSLLFSRRNVDQTDHHLRNSATDLTLPKPKREFLQRSFKYSGAKLWNQLLNEAKLTQSIYSLSKCIKT